MKYGGSFVEFGATDGRTISNTWMLERCFGWRGVLAEPNPTWHGSLKANRPGAIIDTRCVWQSSGSTLEFTQTSDPEFAGVARTHREVLGTDAAIDHGSRIITVETVSLNDLLREHGVPHDFDFLSVDTEGSESVILAALDLDVYRPRCIVVEHGGRDLNTIVALLEGRNYRRVFPELSKYDAWFVDTPA